MFFSDPTFVRSPRTVVMTPQKVARPDEGPFAWKRNFSNHRNALFNIFASRRNLLQFLRFSPPPEKRRRHAANLLLDRAISEPVGCLGLWHPGLGLQNQEDRPSGREARDGIAPPE
jgi:hypothetical protein